MEDNVLVEEREEIMISPTGGDQFLKTAHFLAPSVASINNTAAASAAAATAPPPKYKHLPLKVLYNGWKRPSENWISWIDHLYSSHNSTWKRAGILDSIIASKCFIPRSDNLILELVEKWCPKTNSFVFPWGEATITLEDIMVLGGYPVLGESVLICPQNQEMEETVKKLEASRTKIANSRARIASKEGWLAQFKGSGSEIEHAAFLSYWLSRFVFPSSKNSICKRVLPIAVHLARGTQIALAPTLLANIYKSLTILKAAIILARKSGKTEAPICEFLQVSVPAPLVFVQVWIWERFPSLRPMLVSVGQIGPRLARWNRVKLGKEHKAMSIDIIGKDFQWRPYTFPGLVYMENERWEVVDSDLDEDLKGFVRCLRTSELVSLEGDSMEQYLPHRVAMQFGMDQDIPGDVQRVNGGRDIAWKHYTRPIRDVKLYVPPRFSEPHVTARYLMWWKTDVVGGIEKGRETNQDLFGRKSEADVLSVPPLGFSLAWKKVVQKGKGSGIVKKIPECSSTINNGCSKGLKMKSSKRKFVGSPSSGGKRPGCNDSKPPRPKKRGKFVENSSEKRCDGKSSKRLRKETEISSGYKSDHNSNDPPTGFAPKQCREEANQSSSSGKRSKRKLVEVLSGENSGDSSNGGKGCSKSKREVVVRSSGVKSDPPPGFAPQCNQAPMDEQTKSSGTGHEERIRIVEKLVSFLQAGKLVCL